MEFEQSTANVNEVKQQKEESPEETRCNQFIYDQRA
jgi:hypothetical protein